MRTLKNIFTFLFGATFGAVLLTAICSTAAGIWLMGENEKMTDKLGKHYDTIPKD